MEQYFAQQLSNCCKLNFYHNVIKSQKPLLSPRKSPQKLIRTFNIPQKKSLKRVLSDQALSLKKQDNLQLEKIPENQMKSGSRKEVLDNYGNFVKQHSKHQSTFQKHKQNVLLAGGHFINQVINSKNNLIRPNLEKKQLLKNQVTSRSPGKYQPIKITEIDNKMQTSTLKVENYHNSHRKIIFIEQRPQYINFQQVSNVIPSRKNQLEIKDSINKFNSDIIQPPFVKSKIKKTYNDEVKIVQCTRKSSKSISPEKKERNFQESQYFSKILDQVDLEPQIKKDLIKSLQFNITQSQQTDSILFKHSGLTKSPSLEQSTIIPLESKLLKKVSWHDSFKCDRKYRTQKLLKTKKSSNQSNHQITIDKKQNFRSIVSVHSQNQSSEAFDSVIIEKHSQRLFSSPLKSLL